MSGFQRFEEIEAWQKTRELTKQIYFLSYGALDAELIDAGLIDKTIFDNLYKITTEIGNLLGGFIKYLSRGIAK